MTKINTEINADNARACIKGSFGETDPLWAIARALQSIAITQGFILDRMNVGMFALTEVQQEILVEQRKMNELLLHSLQSTPLP